ncbi:hypothetical protein K0504_09710 [Neiella marina]|uniref:Uncharacterized protein n=1 Tax=Neiella holothuriorum TaxID=2870530 RepID=A0ABS7EG53_9GAMM|nr:hypothetical protein [Neiella holothuriorum]MBW8191312.1 hypothetical protein [Neiella holothuriorum]
MHQNYDQQGWRPHVATPNQYAPSGARPNVGDQSNQPASYQPSQQSAQPSKKHGPFDALFSLKVHGAKTALELKPDITRKDFHTVRIEAAHKKNDGTKQFDWDNKIVLQITKSELPVFCQVFLGLLNQLEFKGHNVGDVLKSMKAAHQPGKVFVNLQETGKQLIAIPVSLPEAVMFGHVALVQYCQNFPGLSTDAALASFRAMAQHQMRA